MARQKPNDKVAWMLLFPELKQVMLRNKTGITLFDERSPKQPLDIQRRSLQWDRRGRHETQLQ